MLASGIWTRDISKAYRTAHRLRAGAVWIKPEEVEAAAGIAVVNVCRALRLVSVCWNSITHR